MCNFLLAIPSAVLDGIVHCGYYYLLQSLLSDGVDTEIGLDKNDVFEDQTCSRSFFHSKFTISNPFSKNLSDPYNIPFL